MQEKESQASHQDRTPPEKSSAPSERRTPLFEEHKRLKAKMSSFGGWNMPIFYSSVLAEHRQVRNSVGIFDVSHMGEFTVRGAGALAFLQRMLTNDVSTLKPGHGQYTALCLSSGGMVDDLIVYRTGAEDYLLCVNAGNTEKDYNWLRENLPPSDKTVQLCDESALWGQIAIQGPLSLEAVLAISPASLKDELSQLPYMHILPIRLHGENCLLARTGYTGELGFELYLAPSIAAKVWTELLQIPSPSVQAIGLGARDTLRLESCYLLYGNDMDETVSPLEAGIGWAVKLGKGDFMGSSALAAEKKTGLKRKLLAFKMEDSSIPRHGMNVYQDGQMIGQVQSGSVFPTVGGSGGMALLSSQMKEQEPIFIDVRGNLKSALITAKPFYKARIK